MDKEVYMVDGVLPWGLCYTIDNYIFYVFIVYIRTCIYRLRMFNQLWVHVPNFNGMVRPK